MCVDTSLTSLVGSFESVIQSCCENQDNSVKPKEEELDQVKQDTNCLFWAFPASSFLLSKLQVIKTGTGNEATTHQ